MVSTPKESTTELSPFNASNLYEDQIIDHHEASCNSKTGFLVPHSRWPIEMSTVHNEPNVRLKIEDLTLRSNTVGA